MPQALDNVIVAAVAHPATYAVSLRWANGAETINSFRHLLPRGVMKRLADPVYFARVVVGERGRSLVWPDEIDFCADALWFDVHPEDNAQQASAAALATLPTA
jgi:hypothetical protein